MKQVKDEKVLEVDYACEATLLYLLIEQKDWDGVKYQAENFAEEARTWVRRVESKSMTIRWRVLPIHSALLQGVPSHVLVSIGPVCR